VPRRTRTCHGTLPGLGPAGGSDATGIMIIIASLSRWAHCQWPGSRARGRDRWPPGTSSAPRAGPGTQARAPGPQRRSLTRALSLNPPGPGQGRPPRLPARLTAALVAFKASPLPGPVARRTLIHDKSCHGRVGTRERCQWGREMAQSSLLNFSCLVTGIMMIRPVGQRAHNRDVVPLLA
jgi:hypothetical protein